ncbi:MAG: ABC transporter permease [Candidatus Rokuibacteriota bacterium]|nr:MAG: ABC transporter permease [Candidatus Rokubacteria bacterium]
MLDRSKPRAPMRQTHTPPAKAPALEVSTTLVVRRGVAFLERHPGVASLLLVLPGTIWMMLFVGIPLASIVLFSFWRSGFAGLVPDYNVENYAALLGGRTFWRITFWTYEVVIIALAGVIVLAYPAAYAIWRVVRDDRWKTAVLLLCVVPFWTSYLTRTITWLPMFGREGVVNRVLLALGVIGEPLEILLYTPYSMMWGLWSLYIVFMIGPLYHSMTKIDEDVMSAAAMLGATPLRTFFHVVLPLTRPGLMAGSLFVMVLGLGEFFTERVIGGAQNPMLAGLILRQIDIFQWASASAIAVTLTVLTLVTVSAMLRLFDLRKV